MKTIILSLMASAGCFAQQVDWVSQVRNKPVADTRQYNFSPQAQTSTIAGGSTNQAAHFAPCPLGVNGTDVAHYLYVSTVGTPEAVLITGGTCTAGAATGTVLFTPQYTHAAGWKIASATGGVAEAQQTATTGGTIVLSSPVTATGQTTISNSNITLQCTAGATMTAGFNGATLVNVTGSNVTIQGCTFDGNQPTALITSALIQVNGDHFTLKGCTVRNSYTNGVVIGVVHHTVITENLVTGNLYTGIWQPNGTLGATYTTVSNNEVSSLGATSLYSGAISIGNASNVVISGNNIEIGGNQDGGIYYGVNGDVSGAINVQNATITGNTVAVNGSNSFECGNVTAAYFVHSGNTCTVNVTPRAGMIGWEFNSPVSGVINSPMVHGNGMTGSAVYLENPANTVVTGGFIDGLGPGGNCVFLQATAQAIPMHDNLVTGVSCIGYQGGGVGLGVFDFGIDSYLPSPPYGQIQANNAFIGNYAKGSTSSGHECFYVGNNSAATQSETILKNNVMESCYYGVQLTTDSSSIIVENNTIRNSINLIYDGAPNALLRVIDTNSKAYTASGGYVSPIESLVGTVTSESLTTAAGATYTLTLTVSNLALITANSIATANVFLGGSTTGLPQIVSVKPGAGTLTIVVKNIHATDAFNGTIEIQYQAMTP